MIRAETHPDTHRIHVHFDATSWFEQASDDDILRLSKCDAMYTPPEWDDCDEAWGEDYPADVVATWMADKHGDIGRMFTYTSIEGCGFGCRIHGNDARAWLAEHRPHLLDQINQE